MPNFLFLAQNHTHWFQEELLGLYVSVIKWDTESDKEVDMRNCT